MRKYIAIVFPTEAKAYDGFRTLRELHDDGAITLYETLVIQREADGCISTKRTSERPLQRTGIGALLGALVGMFGGPVVAVFGATAGGSLGAIKEAIHWSISDEYVEDIGKQLTPGTFALLAEIHEKGPGPIDARIEELGGKVLRETRADFFADMIEKRVHAHRAEVEEHRLTRATEQAEKMELYVEADLQDARAKLRRTAEDARAGLDETKLELDDKIKALEAQIAKVKPGARKELEQRMHEIQDDLAKRSLKLTNALAIAEGALRR